jgi:hypothetical protein
MSFTLPRLDTVAAPDLLAELIRRIPQVSSKWTDYNESDPGITILEMLTWIVEATAYQANAVPFEAYRNMLRMVLGLAFSTDSRPYAVPATQGLDLAYYKLQEALAVVEQGALRDYDTLQQLTYRFRDDPYVASTTGDLEALALETNHYIEFWNKQHPERVIALRVARAYVIYGDDAVDLYVLEQNADPASSYEYLDEHLPESQSATQSRVMVAYDRYRDPAKYDLLALRKAVWNYVTPRAMLGSPISVHSVNRHRYIVTCNIRCLPRENPTDVADAVAKAIVAWLEPYPAGGTGAGWRYGAAAPQTSVLPALSQVQGVALVEDLQVKEVSLPQDSGVGPAIQKLSSARLGLPQLEQVMVFAVEADS